MRTRREWISERVVQAIVVAIILGACVGLAQVDSDSPRPFGRDRCASSEAQAKFADCYWEDPAIQREIEHDVELSQRFPYGGRDD